MIQLPPNDAPEGMVWSLQRDRSWVLETDPDAGKQWYDITRNGEFFCGYTDKAFAERVLAEYRDGAGDDWQMCKRKP